VTCKKALEEYLREDLAALEDPRRQDQRIILQDLRFLFRAYGKHFKQAPDWVPGKG
jgi:hypothetical protein